MNHIETKRPMPGSEVQNNFHIRCLTVVPTDLQALLEKLEADSKTEAQSETETEAK